MSSSHNQSRAEVAHPVFASEIEIFRDRGQNLFKGYGVRAGIKSNDSEYSYRPQLKRKNMSDIEELEKGPRRKKIRTGGSILGQECTCTVCTRAAKASTSDIETPFESIWDDYRFFDSE